MRPLSRLRRCRKTKSGLWRPEPWRATSHSLPSFSVLLYSHRDRSVRAQELCESGDGRPGFPVPNSPYGLCRRKATSKNEDRSDCWGQRAQDGHLDYQTAPHLLGTGSPSELGKCVKVEAPVPNKHTVFVDVKQRSAKGSPGRPSPEICLISFKFSVALRPQRP